MSQIVISVLSALAAAGLVGLAALLGFRAERRISGLDALHELLSETESGARIGEHVIDEKGRAAIAKLEDGRLFAVAAVGDRFATRIFSPAAVQRVSRRANVSGKAGVIIVLDDLGFGPLRLRFSGREPPSWLEQVGRL